MSDAFKMAYPSCPSSAASYEAQPQPPPEAKSLVQGQDMDLRKSDKTDKLSVFKGSLFMVGVAGIALMSGFGMTVARARRKHPGSFNKGILPDPSVSLHESGSSLGLRALLWGSLFAVTGFGSLTLVVCTILGVKSVEDFKTKFQSVAPRIRRNEDAEPEEVTLRELYREILEEDDSET